MSENLSNQGGIEKWMGYVAVLVATIAAFAALYEARMNREHQAISVWPYLDIWAGTAFEENSEFEPFSFNIANKGVGPAIIEKLDLYYKGKKYQSWYGLMSEISKEKEIKGDLGLIEAELGIGEVIEAGGIHKVVRSSNGALARVMATEIYSNKSISLETCYCSLYKDCWELTFPDTRPREVNTCEVRK